MNNKHLVLCISILVGSLVACGDDNNGDPTDSGGGSGSDTTEVYVAPSYADDYSNISNWANRSQWNLANVHDPTVEKSGDYYYMYGTDASYGNVHLDHGHYPYRRSKDLVNWEFLGMSMPAIPAWIKDSLNSVRNSYNLVPITDPQYGFWAPVVRKVGYKYRMYYSVIIDNYIKTGAANTSDNFDNSWTERAFIGLRESDYLANNLWTDKGMVVSSVTDKGSDWSRSSLSNYNAYFKYNAIDPSYIVTPENEHWLIYGSWHSGIMAVQINPQTGLPLTKFDVNDSSTWGTPIYTRANGSRWQGSEAPEIIYNSETGYYYMFLAYDELSVAYNTRVCRSKRVTGPYVGYDGKDISLGGEVFPIVTHPYKFANHSGWVGISHCAIFQNPDTKAWFYASQGRLPANTNGNAYSNAIMMGHVREIKWTDEGWPVVMPERYAAVPQTEIKETDLVGSWENIFLNYKFAAQQSSVSVTLAADKTVSGAISGTWSYDATNNTLSIGSYKVIVERGLDWEATPRVPTIVYAGLTDKGIAVWGKKSQ
jgi:arabinan endo-1,5-alpha-L-arabinosidase